jgi:hypothetical protein
MVTINCDIGYKCVSGVCTQYPCESIVNPTSQTSCLWGYVNPGNTCVFVPANLAIPAHCEERTI